MNLDLSETQQMLKAGARELLARECPYDLVRETEGDPAGFSRPLWRQMSALGWPGLAVPERYGGAGGSFMDLAVLLEETGRALAPAPLFSTAVLGALTLLDAASDPMKDDLLPRIAAGQALATLAVVEPGGGWEPQDVKLQARRDGERFVINGVKLFVPNAHASDFIITAVRTAQDAGPEEGVTLLLVPGAAEGLTPVPHRNLASDGQCEVTFDGVSAPLSAVVGRVDEGGPVLRRTLQRAAAAKAVEMVGSAEAVLDMTVDYLKQRVQFGRPVGAFQAVQHHCANMSIDLEGSRLAAYQAVWKLSQGQEAAREASTAKAWVSDACLRICSLAHQCHGAVGFTQEHNLQLHTRRARSQEQAYGDAGFHRRLLARGLAASQTP